MLRGRLRRVLRRRPAARPANFNSLDPLDQLTWLAEHNLYNDVVREVEHAGKAEEEARAAERAEIQGPPRPPEPTVEVVPSAPVAAERAPPTRPHRPRHAGEPDPAAVPPQNQWWETMCRFRFRGPDEAYDDEPPEQDELDELIYGGG
jgi:hypothetical protein